MTDPDIAVLVIVIFIFIIVILLVIPVIILIMVIVIRSPHRKTSSATSLKFSKQVEIPHTLCLSGRALIIVIVSCCKESD